jgi:hypothetical protein
MRGTFITAGAIALVGAIWIGQGLGILRGTSFMVSQPFWAVAGAVLVVVSVSLAIIAWRSQRPKT